jgi:hypothetical protein
MGEERKIPNGWKMFYLDYTPLMPNRDMAKPRRGAIIIEMEIEFISQPRRSEMIIGIIPPLRGCGCSRFGYFVILSALRAYYM